VCTSNNLHVVTLKHLSRAVNFRPSFIAKVVPTYSITFELLPG